jgi:uncharacterized FlaG/YvyC family protein
MSKKYLFIITTLAAVSICFGIISIYFFTQTQRNRIQNSMLEKKVNEYEKQLKIDNEKLTKLGKQVNDLRNELEYYTEIPENPFYEEYKKRIFELIERDIGKIVKEEPSFGGKWFVTKIRFIDPLLVSVDYEDGHNPSSSRIRIIRSDENVKFEEVK